MKNSEKKAIILNNSSSPYIYQTIIILNENGILHENRALKDAEKIVSDYLKTQNGFNHEDTLIYSKKAKKKNRFSINIIIGTFLILSAFFIGFISF